MVLLADHCAKHVSQANQYVDCSMHSLVSVHMYVHTYVLTTDCVLSRREGCASVWQPRLDHHTLLCLPRWQELGELANRIVLLSGMTKLIPSERAHSWSTSLTHFYPLWHFLPTYVWTYVHLFLPSPVLGHAVLRRWRPPLSHQQEWGYNRGVGQVLCCGDHPCRGLHSPAGLCTQVMQHYVWSVQSPALSVWCVLVGLIAVTEEKLHMIELQLLQ